MGGLGFFYFWVLDGFFFLYSLLHALHSFRSLARTSPSPIIVSLPFQNVPCILSNVVPLWFSTPVPPTRAKRGNRDEHQVRLAKDGSSPRFLRRQDGGFARAPAHGLQTPSHLIFPWYGRSSYSAASPEVPPALSRGSSEAPVGDDETLLPETLSFNTLLFQSLLFFLPPISALPPLRVTC